ncbi:hypothetical protein HDV03_004367 [Kappamyces sp. JEL0829]|nr:hypothetical protein HDV03_004367 [Kappamyces sp. JEL0829]
MDYIKKTISIFRKHPVFMALTLLAFILASFHITAVSGSWVTYTFPAVVGLTEIKLGLFNGAQNNTWTTHPYSICIEQAYHYPVDQIDDHARFCNAQLINGILILLNLFFTFGAACLLALISTESLLDRRVLQAKWLLLGGYVFTWLSNMIAFSLGASWMYKTVDRDFSKTATVVYGIGYIATILNWLLCSVIIFGVFVCIDSNGLLVNPFHTGILLSIFPFLRPKPASSFSTLPSNNRPIPSMKEEFFPTTDFSVADSFAPSLERQLASPKPAYVQNNDDALPERLSPTTGRPKPTRTPTSPRRQPTRDGSFPRVVDGSIPRSADGSLPRSNASGSSGSRPHPKDFTSASRTASKPKSNNPNEKPSYF